MQLESNQAKYALNEQRNVLVFNYFLSILPFLWKLSNCPPPLLDEWTLSWRMRPVRGANSILTWRDVLSRNLFGKQSNGPFWASGIAFLCPYKFIWHYRAVANSSNKSMMFVPETSQVATWLDVKSGPVTPPTADGAGIALLFYVRTSFSQIVKQ